jgi:N-acetylglucosaminyldiphosphoundecaprenol N-acetyl-beta-D-mannosaminyltransferase
MLKKDFILDVGITNETSENILEYILERLNTDQKFYIVTPNPEIIVYANRHESFKNILNNAEISLPDGTGLFLASILMGKPFRQRIPGVNFVEEICKSTVRKPISIGFLGGRAGVAQKTAECLLRKYPYLEIVFVSEEWDDNGSGFAWGDKIKDLRLKKKNGSKDLKSYILNPKSIDLLFVAFGHPKQEEWICNNLDKIPAKAAMGVGGAFDFISGEVKRAPFMIRAIGFEWLYRLVREPWRWRRQLALIEFVKLVFRERFGKN